MRKASLNLSVNAIVIFVLAFAMLGVGLTFTGLIRENVTGATKDIIPKSDFKNPPTAQNPITITDELTIKRGAKKKVDLGFYNKDAGTAQSVQLGIRQCLKDDGTEMTELPNVVSPVANVDASDWKGFKVIIDVGSSEAVEDAYTSGDYVCTFSAYKSGDSPDPGISDPATSGYIFNEKQIFMSITS